MLLYRDRDYMEALFSGYMAITLCFALLMTILQLAECFSKYLQSSILVVLLVSLIVQIGMIYYVEIYTYREDFERPKMENAAYEACITLLLIALTIFMLYFNHKRY